MSENLPAVQQVSVMELEPISPQILAKQVMAIDGAMKTIMKEDVHYGKIPGTDKPTLLQPGAQKIGLMFRLAPSFKEEVIDLPNNHREVRVTCTLTSPNGALVGQGVGVCSTMESKYRYRGNDVEFTDVPVPKSFWEDRNNEVLAGLLNQAQGTSYTGKQVQAKKNDSNQWVVCIKGEKKENPDIADTHNTVLKMAAKRAHVHAILAATGASDMFTQDVEDMQSHSEGESQPAKKADAAPQRQAEVVKHPSSKNWEEYKYRYHLPLKKEGHDMEAVRASIKAKGWKFNSDDKHWYSDDYSEKLAQYIRPLDGRPVAIPSPKQESNPQQTVALSEDDDLPAWDFNDQDEGMPNT